MNLEDEKKSSDFFAVRGVHQNPEFSVFLRCRRAPLASKNDSVILLVHGILQNPFGHTDMGGW
jgi:hypothetical protein